MRPEALLFVLILLACPLMMLFMMRGHGGHGGMRGMHGDGSENIGEPTVDELRSQRDVLEAEITRREQAECERPRTPART
jgi:hypothetical protein